MLAVHTIAVKIRLLNGWLALGYWYTAVHFQLNNVIIFFSTMEDSTSTKLLNYITSFVFKEEF